MGDAVIDFASLDAAANEATDVGQEATETQVTDQSQAVQENVQTETQVDGRRGPANIRNSIKAASEALPDQAQAFKDLGNSYFREQAYKQHFPTPQEAAAAKQLITDIGGVEGIAGLQQRAQTYEQQDNALRDGNPEVLDSFFKDFPEGAAALAPHYLDKLSHASPEAFQTAIAPYAIGMLESAGVGNHLQAILNEADPARAKNLIQQLADWYKGQTGNVQQIKQTRSATASDPGQKRIKEQQEKLNQEREQLFSQSVSERVNTSAGADISKAADAYVKQYKLGTEQAAFFKQQLGQKIVDELNADKDYKKQIDIRKAAKDRNPNAIADFMVSQVRARLPRAALALAKQMYGAGAATQQVDQSKATTQRSSTGGAIFLSAPPSNDVLDMNRPDAAILRIQGKGYRKSDGALVTWRK